MRTHEKGERPEPPPLYACSVTLTLSGRSLLQVHQGIKGMVLDENYNNLTGAVISITGINHDVTSGRKGVSAPSVELGTSL